MNADNTSTDTVIDGTATEIPAQPPKPGKGIPKRTWVVGALALPLAFGAAGLSLARNGTATVTPVEPVAIQALAPSGATAIKGDVAEIFGNKFVVQDATGRALVETGPAGEGGKLVAKGESVTVQGRFENGFLHARVLTRTDGRQDVIGPAGGPPPVASTGRRTRSASAPRPTSPP